MYHNPIHPYTACSSSSVPDIGQRWDPKEKFVPEQVSSEIAEFYANNRGRGPMEVETNHKVLMSIE